MCAIAAVSRTLIHVRFWHLADIRGTATFCPLPDQSGQRSILAGDDLSANDPKQTSGPHDNGLPRRLSRSGKS